MVLVVYARKVFADVTKAGLEPDVIKDLAMLDAMNMDNVEMELVFAHKGGMEDIAHCVRIKLTKR